MIQEGNVLGITCPDAECKKQGHLDAGEINTIVEDATFERYERLRFSREVELDPTRMWCPEVGCETVCTLCSEDIKTALAVTCPKVCYRVVYCS